MRVPHSLIGSPSSFPSIGAILYRAYRSRHEKQDIALCGVRRLQKMVLGLLIFSLTTHAGAQFIPLPPIPTPPPPPPSPILPAISTTAALELTAAAAAGWTVGSYIRGPRASADSFADGREVRDPEEGVKGGWFSSSVTADAQAEGKLGSSVQTKVEATTLPLQNVDITFPIRILGAGAGASYSGVGYGQAGVSQKNQKVSEPKSIGIQALDNTFIATLQLELTRLYLVAEHTNSSNSADFSLNIYATQEGLSDSTVTPDSYFFAKTVFASGVSFHDNSLDFTGTLLDESMFDIEGGAAILKQPLQWLTQFPIDIPAGVDDFRFVVTLDNNARIAAAASEPGTFALTLVGLTLCVWFGRRYGAYAQLRKIKKTKGSPISRP